MSARTAKYLIVIIVVAIALINFYAVKHALYFYYWWLDIPMHIFGGFWIGFTAIALIQWKQKRAMPLKERFFYAFTIAIGIGVLWEMFELVSDMSFALEPYVYNPADTFKDIFDDLVGGALAGVFGHIHQHHAHTI